MQGNKMLRERGKSMRGGEIQYLAQCTEERAKECSQQSSSPVALIEYPLVLCLYHIIC